jgi:methionyl-tRNA formyltransferase
MRVCFFGTPDFAVPTLDALVEHGHEVVAVVAQPDRPSGRGQRKTTPPVAVRAKELGLELHQPTALKSGPFLEWWAKQDIDVAVVVAFGRILPPAYIDGPRHGCINVHASLLPKYRGAAPIQWCLIKGEEETGCVTMRLEDGLDTGPIYLTRRTPVAPEENALELFHRLAPLGAELLIETLERLPHIEPARQDDELATFAPPLHKDDGRIDWTRPAKQIHDLVRGTNPWPERSRRSAATASRSTARGSSKGTASRGGSSTVPSWPRETERSSSSRSSSPERNASPVAIW